MTYLESLYVKATELLGRAAEVEKTKDGKYIVSFFSLTLPPPPKGATAEEALERFIEWKQAFPTPELPPVDKELLDAARDEDISAGLPEN